MPNKLHEQRGPSRSRHNTKYWCSIENDAVTKLYELYQTGVYCRSNLLYYFVNRKFKGVTLFLLIALLFTKVFHSLESKVLQRHYSSQQILHSVTFTNIILCFEHTQQQFKAAIQSFIVGKHIQEIITVFQLPDCDLVQSRITSPLLLPLSQNPLKFIYKKYNEIQCIL